MEAVCHRTALRKVLRELWQILLTMIEKWIVLPPMPENVSLHVLYNSVLLDSHSVQDFGKVEVLDLTEKQARILDNMLDILKVCSFAS